MGRVFCARFDERDSNRPPNSCQGVKGDPCAACQNLSQLELRIIENRRVLEDLLEQHREASTVMNRAHNPLILQVPREITSLIFNHCFPPAYVPLDSTTVLPKTFSKYVASRLVLGAVCREWRHIAWSTPQLWTELAISLRSCLPWKVEFIQQWLDRSGALPLSISVLGPNGFTPDQEMQAQDIIHVLDQVSDRWRILELNNTVTEYHSLFKGNGSPRSVLEALSIEGLYSSTTRATFDLPNGRPTPTRVVLSRIWFHVAAIDWDKVTCLVLKGRKLSEYCSLLQQTSNLRNLTLDVFDHRYEAEIPPRSIILSKLDHLHINGYDPEAIGIKHFLEACVISSLTKLTVSDDGNDLPIRPLLRFIKHARCRLIELTINRTYYDSLMSFLEFLPSLERLTLAPWIGYDTLPDGLLMRLAETAVYPGGKAVPFLPRLRSFVYNATGKYYSSGRLKNKLRFPWKTLSEILGPVEDLYRPNLTRRPLESLEFYFEVNSVSVFLSTIDPKSLCSLLAIVNSGLQLTIECTEDDGTTVSWLDFVHTSKMCD